MDEKMLGYVFAYIGVFLMFSLCCYGSCSALSVGLSTAILYTDKSRTMVSRAYMSAIGSLALFIFGLMTGFIAAGKISKADMDLSMGTRMFFCTLSMGLCISMVGEAFGKIGKHAFKIIGKNDGFFIVFLMFLGIVELVGIVSLIQCLLQM